ncbi:TSUP family transporter [Geodermatophilus sp. CPCC 205506]|uniref:TSUP family transporter n=1 Tax=Geodermatophilus sp. CPCC 205506 TaxID=2936596 RepID=UPI003EE832C1
MTSTGDGTASSETTAPAAPPTARRPLWLAACAGTAVGLLGGLVGLGGAEFRLPLLISLFAFAALSAVIVNKAMSLVVVTAALPSRLTAVPLDALAEHWFVAVSLLVGSLPGAWVGASWAIRMRATTLYRVLGALLLAIAAVFAAEHLGTLPQLPLPTGGQAAAGVVAGFGIGVVAALMGVAGGELLIPTIVLLYAVDVKLAGSLSLLVSLPTMLVGFFRYSRDQAFTVLRDNGRFVVAMAAGSVVGSVTGGLLLGAVPSTVLVPLVIALLLFSAVKVWRHA